MMARLDQILDGFVSAPAWPVAGLTLDSRQVVPGGVFVALAGLRQHGLAFAAEAERRGAAAILFAPPAPDGMTLPASAIPVSGLGAALGCIADRYFEAPSQALRVIGVTGTNGKTSTVQLLAQALEGAGRRAGTIGTLGTGLFGALHEGERTTPDVVAVHAALAAMRDAGAQDVAMEVSSHALDQGRVDGVRFQVAVFTNLTRDHLDYHGSMGAYGAAKARLFDWSGLHAAVINLDDPFGARLHARGVDVPVRIGLSSRGAHGATLHARDVVLSQAGLAFDLCEAETVVPVRSGLLGRFNVDNLLAVAGVLRALGWPLDHVAGALSCLSPVAGRMNRLDGIAGRPLVVVDYAHTPDALEQALASLRGHTQGRLICVFGCGGERDTGKRPQMAAIAERLADRIVVTDDNPRGENGDVIVDAILAGFSDPAAVTIERDRGAAIAHAIDMASPQDTVLIAGKGHEPYQDVAGVKYPFDDRAVALRVLEGRP